MPFLPVITGDTAYCPGGSVLLDAGPGFDSYLWSNSTTSQTTSVTQGSYTVEAVIGGCSFTTPPYIVTEYPDPTVQITGNIIYCPGDSVLLNATQGFDSYLWNTGINDTLDSIYVFQGSYNVTVTDSNSCQKTSNTLNVVDFTNTVNITGNTTYCLGDSVLLDAGAGYTTYLWDNGAITQTIYATQGQHWVTVTLNSCTASDTTDITLTVVPIPVITGETSYCAGSSVALDADSIGNGYNAFSWNTSPIQTNQTINLTQGTYYVVVTLNGCKDSSSQITITENALPTPIIIGSLHYCSNDSNGTNLSTVNSYDLYNWSNSTTGPVTLASTGNISVTVTDANGCGGSTQVLVTSSAPANNITGVKGFCSGETITISADPGFSTYLWNSGETTQNILTGQGVHSVTVTDINGCENIEAITLVPEPSPIANFTINPLDHGQPDESITFTDASTISAGNIISWDWNFDVNSLGGANPTLANTQGPHIVEYSNQGTFTVSLIVTSDSNCIGTTSIDYLIVDDIIIPNVITPNNDGFNDFLTFTNLEFHPGNTLVVFNRWGGKIFEKENYNNDWDGGGHAVGTYYFILTVADLDKPIKGTLTILE